MAIAESMTPLNGAMPSVSTSVQPEQLGKFPSRVWRPIRRLEGNAFALRLAADGRWRSLELQAENAGRSVLPGERPQLRQVGRRD